MTYSTSTAHEKPDGTVSFANGTSTINAKAIAEGLYEMFDDEQKACLAFGMIPAVFMEVLEKQLNEKAESLAADSRERQFGFRPSGPVADADWKKQFVSEAVHAVSVALYGVAPMVV